MALTIAQLNKRLNRPIEIQVEGVGSFNLRPWTWTEAEEVRALLAEEISDQEFTARMLHRQVCSPEVTLGEIASLPHEKLARLARAWSAKDRGLATALPKDRNTFHAFREAVKEKATYDPFKASWRDIGRNVLLPSIEVQSYLHQVSDAFSKQAFITNMSAIAVPSVPTMPAIDVSQADVLPGLSQALQGLQDIFAPDRWADSGVLEGLVAQNRVLAESMQSNVTKILEITSPQFMPDLGETLSRYSQLLEEYYSDVLSRQVWTSPTLDVTIDQAVSQLEMPMSASAAFMGAVLDAVTSEVPETVEATIPPVHEDFDYDRFEQTAQELGHILAPLGEDHIKEWHTLWSILNARPTKSTQPDMQVTQAQLPIQLCDRVLYFSEQLCHIATEWAPEDLHDAVSIQCEVVRSFMWDPGESVGRVGLASLLKVSAMPALLVLTADWVPLSDREIIKLVEKWDDPRYRGKKIEVAHVRTWLKQFPAGRARLLMARVLQNVRFVGYGEARDALAHTHREVLTKVGGELPSNGQENRLLLSGFGNIQKSAPAYARMYASRNNIPTEYIASPGDLLGLLRKRRSVRALVFVDDLIGSGGTYVKHIEVLPEELKEEIARRGIRVFFTAVFGLDKGVDGLSEKVAKLPFEAEVLVQERLGEFDQCFNPRANIFDSEQDRLDALKIAGKYGKKLKPKYPLGYDDGQLLLVLADNTPNNTLPIIWAAGPGKKWLPLFERT